MHASEIDFTKLAVAERIELAERLWDSVAAEIGGLPVTEAQEAELERRLAERAADPAAGEPWEVVRSRIARRLDKAR